MSEEAKVEVELHDEDINDIVEETLEEETVEENLLILNYSTRVRKKTNLRNQWTACRRCSQKTSHPAPKTKAGMISAMTSKMLKMSKDDMAKLHAQYHNESVEMEEDEVISESPEVDTTAELDALVESEALSSDEFKRQNRNYL